MKIFLTGGTGFIGQNFRNLAAKKGNFLYVVSRKKKMTTQKNVKWLFGDISDDWSKELSKSDLLVHFAAAGVNQKNKKEIFKKNIFKSIKLLKNSIKNNCKKWLIISTSSEYGFRVNKTIFSKNSNRLPSDDYGLSKAIFSDQCIKLAKQFRCKTRIMRIFPVYGKGENKNQPPNLDSRLMNFRTRHQKILH